MKTRTGSNQITGKVAHGRRQATLGVGARLLLLLACTPLAFAVLAGPVLAKMSVLDSPHNLSALGGRGRASGLPGVVFSEERQVCVFCHVPHRAVGTGPLWSRDLPLAEDYTPYNKSSTLNANPKPGKPTGASRLCLSCHDGTIALGHFVGSTITVSRKMPSDAPASANANLTQDLQDDHPISFAYTEALALQSNLVSPSTLPSSVKLGGGTDLECTACHDPHDNQYGNFLVMNNGGPNYASLPVSPLCVTCHVPPGWSGPAHTTHNPVTIGTSLANGCMNCHSVHSAPGAIRLLKNAKMEDNCLASCHNGVDTASVNVKPLFDLSMHRHPVEQHNPMPGMDHDEKESLPAANYHVQCVDCHNPHQVDAANAPLSAPPLIDGRLKGVRKDSLGNYATTEYEICFKCHSGDNASNFFGVTEPKPNRMILEPDQMSRFDSRNPSFHPVTADRRTSGASLLTALQPTMLRVYCSDCHNNDQGSQALGSKALGNLVGSGPNGPHGSQFPHILIARYNMPVAGAPTVAYNSNQYALCYRCHSEDYIMATGSAFNNGGVNEHAAHVRDRMIPCFVCHDPHGTPWTRLATVANNSHLINFDKSYTVGAQVSAPLYTTTAAGTGNCTVNCHTVQGNNHAYSPSGSVGKAINIRRVLPGPLR